MCPMGAVPPARAPSRASAAESASASTPFTWVPRCSPGSVARSYVVASPSGARRSFDRPRTIPRACLRREAASGKIGSNSNSASDRALAATRERPSNAGPPAGGAGRGPSRPRRRGTRFRRRTRTRGHARRRDDQRQAHALLVHGVRVPDLAVLQNSSPCSAPYDAHRWSTKPRRRCSSRADGLLVYSGNVRVVAEEGPEQRPSTRARCRRLVAGEEEGHQQVAQIVVGHRAAIVVARRDEQRKDVVARRGVRSPPPPDLRGDEIVDLSPGAHETAPWAEGGRCVRPRQPARVDLAGAWRCGVLASPWPA